MEEETRPGGRIRRLIHIDIGMVIFFIILIYILFSIILYVTSRKTEVYEVHTGTLSENTGYRGIALRQESLMKSRYSGIVNYYNKEGDRVRVGGIAYSVDEKGELADYADAGMHAGDYFTEQDIASFRSQSVSFARKFDPADFTSAGSFKNLLATQAQKISNRTILAGIRSLKSTSIHTAAAKETGSIAYSWDTYFKKDFSSLTLKDFDPSQCKKGRMSNGMKVRKGSTVCRIITDENWSVAISVDSEETAKRLREEEYVQVRFRKNGFISWAHVDTRSSKDGGWFVNLEFSNSMEAFCTDRFLDIEILSNEKRGLKVPNSSITHGDFFLVPKEYVFEGSNGQMGVLLRFYMPNGNLGTRFIPSVPYSETDDEYYLDNSVLRSGEILEKKDSQEQFTLEKMQKLVGVYYINKGYPDFRQVDILMQNSEYSIVSPNELYGLQEYDYIVLHANSIRINK